eukprot:Protomagalhaensia_wolfi_Nauph_80__5864@NODE_74_length_3972_cov_2245_061022_g56_i0_p3_GENE_NODE_74_length_3972_cov_2245_061022_g56_i0NODE_74_length_3972_cov_2245_061022_g56_i0_p3_ORF_typecomplete_len179_score13_48Myosin_tail_1/PF01576_19/1_1e05HAP1_N/PF04849_13/3_8e05TolA_bind_tri/PF16331_5/0_00051MPS2/PF17060_5/0_00087DUF3450/PF11932_8/0_0018KIAA1328/PF15369_6/0_0089Cep57_CLD_2/PF14197_6/2_5e02Cep57_CLD_2/PF14197_6/5_3Cep57_CLD_2/PF14197_6/0_021Cep57_CLD_2/PF14197_6/3_4e03HOOK/PF05622_12/0_026Nu
MSFWQCAVGADREVKSSLDTLCLSEAETWSKLSTAMLTSESLKATKNVNSAKATAQRRVDTLAEESERKNQLILNLSKQLNEARESHAALLNKVEALTKQLEMLEAQNLTLSKEKEGITKELVVAQNTVRKLYKVEAVPCLDDALIRKLKQKRRHERSTRDPQAHFWHLRHCGSQRHV